jgi:glycosyltransferase involved in cell wall biosynthesis
MNSDADVLLFVDADEGFEPGGVIKMLEMDKDIIGGIYPMKNFNWENIRKAAIAGKKDLTRYSGLFAMNPVPGTTQININEPMPVTEVGTGLMAIKRTVFEQMEPHCGKYAVNGPDAQFDFNNMVTEYFATSITEEGILLSEDYHFCRKWRSMGGEVYAAPWVVVDHAGEYIFNGRYVSELELNADPVVDNKNKKKK